MVADQTIRDADANAQGSTTMADLMAGLPPLLLGTYTPKIECYVQLPYAVIPSLYEFVPCFWLCPETRSLVS